MILVATIVQAYDLDTHEALSREAFEQSSISSLLEPVYGVQQGGVLRGPLLLLAWTRLTPVDWVARGARDQDDWTRALNHFYDPVHDKPLNVWGFDIGERAPDWALEDRWSYSIQEFSYADARRKLHEALTGIDNTTRERAWGHTFYALGHLIHMIQDMAQPQHTRNDSHLFIGARKSLLESYVERLVPLGAFSLSGGTTPSLALPRDLWVTGTGRGLAEFSNANFVSAGTNFTELRSGATAEQFPSPKLDVADVSSSSTGDQCKDGATGPGPDRVPLTFYGNTFPDPATGAVLRNPRMTTLSIFDQYLEARGLQLIFALNCFNIDAAADILLPRAVSYSAALLKYFFRGSMTASDEVDSSNQRMFRVANNTQDEIASGTFALYVEPEDGTRTLWSSWTLALAPDEISAPLDVRRLPRDTPSETRCIIVFRGQLGAEPDAVMGTPTPCPLEVPPPPPAPWFVYYCAIFGPGDYFYATKTPPLYPDGEMVWRFYAGDFTCVFQTFTYTDALPPNTRFDLAPSG